MSLATIRSKVNGWQMVTEFDIWYLAVFLICLGFSAFFCSAETAFISLSRLRVRHLMNSGVKGAERLQRIREKPENLLAITLLGVNFFETAMAAVGTVMAISLWGENSGAAIATTVITVITLIFAEVIPKNIAARYGERLALTYARPIEFISRLLYPLVYLLSRIGIRFSKLVGKTPDSRATISEGEIRTAISMGKAEGVVEADEAEMLHKVFEFGDRPVREVMTPRTDIIWVEQGAKLADFLQIYLANTHQRFPVYQENTDNVVGIFSIKDVLVAQANNSLSRENTIDELVHQAYFVPEAKRLMELLTEMRENNYHMAIVVDEFGGIAGLITLEQLLEQIVGRIGDELAGAGKEFVAIDVNTFEIDGGLRVEEANNEMKLGLPLGDYETVAGFVLYHLGHIPKPGEEFRYKNFKQAIAEMRGVKIEKVVVTKENTGAVPQV